MTCIGVTALSKTGRSRPLHATAAINNSNEKMNASQLYWAEIAG
jgi:hypothetical protein